MMNILKKCNIHFTTYLLLFIAMICGYFKPVIYLYLIVIIHEIGHIITISLFKYSIVSINIYPFGGITIIDKPLNASIIKDFFIAISGFIMQLFLWFVIKDELFLFFNRVILLFNLLPIIPLDGSHVLKDVLDSFFAFKKSLYLYYIVSFCCLILFFIYQLVYGRNYFILIVLCWQWFVYFKRRYYYLERFYLERYLYYFPYKRIENNYLLDKNVLKKNTRHFFYHNNHYLTEHELLDKYYKIV